MDLLYERVTFSAFGRPDNVRTARVEALNHMRRSIPHHDMLSLLP